MLGEPFQPAGGSPLRPPFFSPSFSLFLLFFKGKKSPAVLRARFLRTQWCKGGNLPNAPRRHPDPGPLGNVAVGEEKHGALVRRGEPRPICNASYHLPGVHQARTFDGGPGGSGPCPSEAVSEKTLSACCPPRDNGKRNGFPSPSFPEKHPFLCMTMCCGRPEKTCRGFCRKEARRQNQHCLPLVSC